MSDLGQARAALGADLGRLDKQQAMHQAELEYARYAYQRDGRLYAQDILPRDQYRDKKKNVEVRESMLAQTRAERQARDAKGVLEQQAELGRRDKELADARAALALLEAGTRPEEIEAERQGRPLAGGAGVPGRPGRAAGNRQPGGRRDHHAAAEGEGRPAPQGGRPGLHRGQRAAAGDRGDARRAGRGPGAARRCALI